MDYEKVTNLGDIDVAPYDTLLLDRDGVINRLRHNDYVKCWEEFEFLPSVLDVLALWAKHFRHIFVVTNQRGVGKNVMTEDTLLAIHRQMCDVIADNGGRIDKIYYCTSLTCDDNRRKPGNGMFIDIQQDFPDVKPEGCLMIGDSESDMQFAENCGIKGVMIISEK